MTDQPTPYPGLYRSEKFAPREQFSISQIEKAFGAGYECLSLDKRPPAEWLALDPATLPSGVIDNGPQPSGTGCLRSWGYRYLGGVKQPEYTWDEACALPEHTEPLRRLKGGAKAKTWGKVAEREIERFLTNDPSLQTKPLDPHVLVGLHLLPHPRDMVTYELQGPIKVKTGANMRESPLDASLGDYVSWQGFKDFTPTLAHKPAGTLQVSTQRYLIDFKTTKPIVNKKDNLLAGRAPNSWAYMKDPDKLVLDWQYNLYEWDELVTHGALVPARWVYFASPGTEQYPNKPEARASDMPVPDIEIVRSVVLALDSRARVLRDHIRSFRSGALTVPDLPANLLACNAYGGCPYRSSVGGPCTAEQTEIIPVGRIVPKTRSTAPKALPAPATGPGFTFNPQQYGAHMSLSIADQIKAQLAAGQAPAQQPNPGATSFGTPPPAAQAHAPGYPASVGAHIGAPVPTAGLPPTFPAAAPAQAGLVAPGPFNPAAFSFGGGPPQAPAPAPVAPPPVHVTHPPFGTQANAEYFCDGQGGYCRIADVPAMIAAGHPEAVRLWGTPAPATPAPVAVAPSPTAGLPPEAFAPGGPAGVPAPVFEPTGSPVPTSPVPTTIAPTDAGKRKRRTKAEMEADAAAARALVMGSDAARDELVQGFAPRDTDPAPSHDTGERIAHALETIAHLLAKLAGT